MNLFHLVIVLAMGAASLATFATSQTLHVCVFALPSEQVAGDLIVPERVLAEEDPGQSCVSPRPV
ncbi:hypothetical protein [Yoonia sediminilitoris]|uniref:Secreted protein n=1 Tax=Yoonia sediminilitoris TaxID=1286148 RepID=A0A2T6K7L2_9RHOB|nr:hypothetical protein [Yoonia sediminilitoris]PUB10709.1 hypothetical protein C8N45_11754 [Yoonia sediminilitoris]RCW90461.1 hypothetical protein DFP92_11754 [Yoonia sediminilitoris]